MENKRIHLEALQLPAGERAVLAAELLASLESLPERELEDLWLAQANQRGVDIDSGLVTLVSADQVRQEALALCR